MALSHILNIYKQNKERWRSGQGRDYKWVGVGRPTATIHPAVLGTVVGAQSILPDHIGRLDFDPIAICQDVNSQLSQAWLALCPIPNIYLPSKLLGLFWILLLNSPIVLDYFYAGKNPLKMANSIFFLFPSISYCGTFSSSQGFPN